MRDHETDVLASRHTRDTAPAVAGMMMSNAFTPACPHRACRQPGLMRTVNQDSEGDLEFLRAAIDRGLNVIAVSVGQLLCSPTINDL